MGQRHVCTFRHAQRAAYRTAISAAQILVIIVLRSHFFFNFMTYYLSSRYLWTQLGPNVL